MLDWSPSNWDAIIKAATALIALYGAGLSTFNYLRAGPKVRLRVRPGMRLAPSSDKNTYIVTEIANYGDRSTTLRSIAIEYFDRPWSWAHLRNRPTKAAVLKEPNTSQPLPYELKPGCIWEGLTLQEPEIVNWAKMGACYFVLYHSHQPKPVRTRLRV